MVAAYASLQSVQYLISLEGRFFMKVNGRLFLLLVLPLSIALPIKAHSADLCSQLAGRWSGSASGKFSGPIIVTFGGGCAYEWDSAAIKTSGSISQSEGKLLYSNAAGSRGVVTHSGNHLTFRNVYTAQRDGAYTVSVGKR